MQIKYETKTCSRCGGSGKFSYNLTHGNKCYGCGGSGVQLTKRGKAARAYATEILEKRVEDVTFAPGQVGFYEWNGKRVKVARVVENHDRPKAKRKDLITGEETELRCFDLYTPSGKVVRTGGDGATIRLVPTEQQAQEIMEYQESLTKAGKPSKRSRFA